MSFWKGLLKGAAGVAAPFTGGASLAAIPMIDAIGGGLSAASNSMTNNRSQQGNIEDEKLRLGQTQERNYFDTLLDADKARNNNAESAFKRLLNITYMGNPEAHVTSPGVAGKYSRPIAGPSQAQVDMANGPLRDETYNRATYGTDPLQGQMPLRTQDYSALDNTGKSSIWEKLLGIAGAGASAYGQLGAKQKP
jgi:hypothetical protein